MSIITKRGDEGKTDLMYGRRVDKTDERVEAYGAVDELNACLGLVRVSATASDRVTEFLQILQKHLIGLMGELATAEEDAARYRKDGYQTLEAEHREWLEGEAKALEKDCDQRFKGWAMPGGEGNAASAHLDLARTVCRRAERRVVGLKQAGRLSNLEIPLFLNRLSDALWIFARYEALVGDTAENS